MKSQLTDLCGCWVKIIAVQWTRLKEAFALDSRKISARSSHVYTQRPMSLIKVWAWLSFPHRIKTHSRNRNCFYPEKNKSRSTNSKTLLRYNKSLKQFTDSLLVYQTDPLNDKSYFLFISATYLVCKVCVCHASLISAQISHFLLFFSVIHFVTNFCNKLVMSKTRWSHQVEQKDKKGENTTSWYKNEWDLHQLTDGESSVFHTFLFLFHVFELKW